MIREEIDEEGFALTHPLLNERECDGLIAALERLVPRGAPPTGGIRNILRQCPRARAVVRSRPVHSLVTAALSLDAFAVRAIYFRKVEESNWSIRWHRDRVVPLQVGTTAGDSAAAGLSGFSVKAGVPHAEATRDILANMLTVRLHLDEANAANGALQVLPGSHLETGDERPTGKAYLCAAPRGTALLMRPLLWHASSRIEGDSPRRVLHIEFADRDLPDGLEWQDRW